MQPVLVSRSCFSASLVTLGNRQREFRRSVLRHPSQVRFVLLLCSISLTGLACPIVSAQETLALDEPTAEQQAVASRCIHAAALRSHIKFLADDLLEGRGPGSKADALTQKYIATQFESFGLQPAAPGGGWLQSVPLVGIRTRAPDTITLNSGDQSLQLRRHDDFVITSGKPEPSVRMENAELVFVGYGIVAPEYDWDDYKGTDLRGKVLVMVNNGPSDDPGLFAGRRRLYYGRWDYKYEMAAQQGAAGAIIIHTTESAGYPYQVVQTSWSGEEFELRGKAGPRLEMRGWLSEDAARKAIALSGNDLDALRGQAQTRAFRPVPLKTTVSVALACDVRQQDTANVIGLLPGSDPDRAKEMVIIMAHHDHLGVAEQPDSTGDRIYNGAVDNASGTAALLTIAHAFSELPQRPARSILFAAVGAEEQGLLGSAYFAQNPPTAPGYLAAVVNIDGVNIFGLTHDVNVIGLGKSSMDTIVERIVKFQRRVVTPDQFPDRGYYYRSDQFSLARIGVPGVYLHGGVQVVGKPDDWGRAQREEWIETHYHQPSDEYDDGWDLVGAVADVQLLFFTGLQAAWEAELPAWNAGDEFEAARTEALEQRE
jgi:Zn-dependent M28 family amino/carboxypeptidase